MTPPNGLCIVMPVLDEAGAGLARQLAQLQHWRERGARLVVADGGSADGTLAQAGAAADLALRAPRGRAAQMNAGAAAALARFGPEACAVLLFLHADTALPADADRLVLDACTEARPWGRFDLRLNSERPLLRLVARLVSLRSRLSGIATGDQAMFVRGALFERLGGFADQPLMEDIELSRRLRRAGHRPVCLRAAVLSSARRWERHGAWRTIVLMWRLRAAYFLGADPARLARRYGYRPRDEH